MMLGAMGSSPQLPPLLIFLRCIVYLNLLTMQILTVSLHDLELLLGRNTERIIQAISKNSENSQPTDHWFNINQLCEYLPDKPKRQTVYGWVHKRAIPFHKKSKALSFLKSEIDDYLKDGLYKTQVEINNAVKTENDTFLISQKRKKKKNGLNPHEIKQQKETTNVLTHK